ncbi:NAD(P)H-dependent glycerol-3-phosphate dehydrogenase [Candidatus Liberibacter sp.]|uniref:NAD(P)H-dependent glycerol-3-phosphate dehydrogenase n=1 Tax=Candidatus Liberibacter sp. TaxID=34022 RepID=UPI0015F76E7E|nr:NAD(P)H-dependent glycerol-3-phosphate dehydrogenase [Candidatus Liberibacter sp.]MBA5724161.1 NAD(P)-dependent glycerol-3-phosphate dehydrogenase [Candidatus Liberibacter sp.]
MNDFPTICVVGSGAFGSALSSVIASRGNSCTTLLGRQENLMQHLKETLIHTKALPDIKLSQFLRFSTDYECLYEADIVLFAVSSKGYGDAISFYGKWLKDSADIVICSKGFECQTGMLLSEYSEKTLPSHPFSVLSGPGFAVDIARGLPVAVTLASDNIDRSKRLSEMLSSHSFRVEYSDDRIGVQLGGALKNVIAIASGILEGKKLGDSARAMLIVQGLSEIAEVTKILGGRADTVWGLSGLGDLMLTATSKKSRNFAFGILLGQGKQLELDKIGLVEGALAASRIVKIAAGFGLELPIARAVSDVVANRITVDESLDVFCSNFLS